jgi:energy-coupling factor transport system permease protein
MSDFDFQRYVTVGQYLPTGSVVHRLDPRVRLGGVLALLIAVAAAPRLAGVALALVALVALLALARVPLGYGLRGLLPALPFVGVLALLQVLFGPRDADLLLAWGPVRVSPASLLAGMTLVARFFAFILCISLASFCIATTELLRGLDALLRPLARLGLPTHDVVTMVQVTLRFLPLLAQEAERIVKAQASRGAEWGTARGGLLRRARRALPFLVPLFLTTLRRAEHLALAMDARGYHGGVDRTSMVELHLRPADALAAVVVLAVAVGIVVL